MQNHGKPTRDVDPFLKVPPWVFHVYVNLLEGMQLLNIAESMFGNMLYMSLRA